MRVGFAGTPAFAATVLRALIEAGIATIPLVLTQPDRPGGRGLRLEPSPVKVLAQERGLAIAQPASLRTEADRARLVGVPLDVLVVAAYGLILPYSVLSWPRHGCFNLHASLLPRWRGAAPIQRALLAGDLETGITVMRMDEGLDTGPIIAAQPVPIAPRDTAGTLEGRLAAVAAASTLGALRRLEADGALPATPQPAAGACYAPKIEKADATIDWGASAAAIDRRIRALDPAPGAVTTFDGETVKLWRAEPANDAGIAAPGTALAAARDRLVVACGEGALRLEELQPASGRRMSAAAFVAGRRVAAGARFGQ
jgi:methionyl-tRNA formyltransferase